MTDTSNAASNVSVPVKSAFLSKVNWIAAATAIAVALGDLTNILQQALPFVPEQYQHWITGGIAMTGGVATILARTFFTASVTPSVASKAS